MRRLSHALGLGALLLAAPLAAERSEAAPFSPYHLAGEAGHGAVQLACADGHGDPKDNPCWKYRHKWAPNPRGDGEPYFGSRLANRSLVESRLGREGFRLIGRITLRDGYYVAPVLDPCGSRVVLVIDAFYGDILGFEGDW
jgi:hypothetical protein